MCRVCGEIGIFDEQAESGVRKPSTSEQKWLDGEEGISRLRAAWRRNRPQ
jgi:hypothetical protein